MYEGKSLPDKNGASAKRRFKEERKKLKTPRSDLPRVNLRPFLFLALGLVFGILLYTRCRFGGVKGTDFILFAVLLALSLRPFSWKRAGVIFLCVAVAAGTGAGLMHFKCERFVSGMVAGEYEVKGTVLSFSEEDNLSALVLGDVSLDGVSVGGRLSVSVRTGQARTGDILSFTAAIARGALPKGGDSYRESLFIKDIRYFATVSEEGIAVTGRGNALLRLNSAVYNVLHSNLAKTQADAAYALLTGNAGSMDDGFATNVRQGGVAHIFAVSGLHIGILYAGVAFLFRRLKRIAPIPSLTVVILYAAFCGFSVSAVRAVVMCAVLGIHGAQGRKYDFTGAIAFAAVLVLLLRPAEWLSAGFRLSFGACLGLALYSRSLKRAFKRLPRFLSDYLSANLAVQIFTFPVLFETFGYFSLWGTALNLALIPALPVLFLGLLLAVVFALIIPPAAFLFFALPNGMLSLLTLVLSFDFSFVLSGFSLGAGGAVWLGGAVLLSERVRLGEKARLFLSIALTALFMLVLVFHNAVFTGCKLIADKGIVLAETRRERILVIDGSRSVASYRDFLSRNCGARLDAVIVLGNAENGVSAALYLPADEVRAFESGGAGLSETAVLTGESFTYGELAFRFENKSKLVLVAAGGTVEIDFTGEEALSADLFLSGENAGSYYVNKGAIYEAG